MKSQAEKKISPSHTTENLLETSQTPDFQPPKAITERYEYVRSLGKGSQGQVWLATRKSDGERVAIKQLHVHSVTTWKQYELFKREAAVLANLDVEGVAPFYDYIEDMDAQRPFVCIIQKYIEGQTLADLLKAKHRFQTEAVYDIIAQVLRILQNLHDYDPPVIHRDIKPSNLMLTPGENGRYRVTLLDFGAVANPQVQNGGSTVAGTFGYMPPEQLMGQAQPASDIYALAAVAVELLSGTSPADIPVCDFKLVIDPYLTHIPTQAVQTLHGMLEPALCHRVTDQAQLIAQFDALASKRQPSLLDFLKGKTVPKLTDVEHIGQSGNYEIWQDLDQQAKHRLYSCPCHLDVRLPEASGLDWIQEEAAGKQKNRVILMGIIGGVAFFSIIALSLIILQALVVIPRFRMDAIFSIIILIYIFILIIISEIISRRDNTIAKTEKKIYDKKPLRKILDSDWQRLRNLLCNGEKIVGRIMHIEYIAASSEHSCCVQSNLIGKLTYDESYIATKSPLEQRIISYAIPKFRLVYHFKYPFGEEQALDFYGELVTHSQPEEHYKVGDPITLIANIIAEDENAYIEAMPYPYPFGNILSVDNILYTCSLKEKDLVNNTPHLDCVQQGVLHWLCHLDACEDEKLMKVYHYYASRANTYRERCQFLAEYMRYRGLTPTI